MIDLDQAPTHSPLSQSVMRDGKTVQVEIYDDADDGWLLEVVDEYGNSTIWDDSFSSDQDAFDEVIRTIEEDGIDSLIGSPSDEAAAMQLDRPLSNAELQELDDLLCGEDVEPASMDVSTLDGFLTAIAIGPDLVRPSEWLPWVWDMVDGEADPNFQGAEQANRIMSLTMRQYSAVLDAFNTDPASFEPIFWRDVCWGAAEWCEGFLLGFQFSEEAWSRLAIGHSAWFTPFLRLGTDDGLRLTERAGDAEKWMNEVEPSLVKIHGYWNDRRVNLPPGQFEDESHLQRQKNVVSLVRDSPRVGRNDPCPCGSGKKFKKCCGANGVPPTVH